MVGWTRPMTAACVACTLLLSPLSTEGTSPASAEQASVSISNTYYNKIDAPVLKPAWMYSITGLGSDEREFGANAIAANGKIIVLDKDGKLTALHASTGKKLWNYGSGMAPLLTYSSGTIFGMNKNGTVIALSEKGQKKWSAALGYKDADHLQLAGNTLYVTAGLQFAALDAASGKIKWKASETDSMYSSGYPQVLQSEHVVIRSYIVQGALSAAQINAYDARTGKKLWEHFKQSFPLTVKDGLVYSEAGEYMFSDDPVNRKIEVSVFNLQTGESKGTRVYP